MEPKDQINNRLKRCFIAASGGRDSEGIAKLLTARGVECLRPEDISSSVTVHEEILRHLSAADFVAGSLHGNSSPNSIFELGVAYALRKPIIIFTVNYDRVLDDLRGVYVVKTESDAIAQAGSEVDRFLRYAKAPPEIEPQAPRMPPGDFTWARKRATALQHERGTSRARKFEQLVSDVFQKAGGQVVELNVETDTRADIVVWLNDLAFETGGPMIVECKHFGGGSGSVFANAKHNVERLEKLIGGSKARLALLVFSHDRPNPPSYLFETPRVLSFSIDQLIDAMEQGTFTEQVIRRRRRAAFSLAMGLGTD